MQKILKEKINFETPPPIVMIFGEEEFLVEECIKEILKRIRESKAGWDEFERYDGESISMGDLADMAATVSLLSPQKTILVKNFEKLVPKAQGKKNLQSTPFGKYLQNPSPSTFLILQVNHSSLNGLTKKPGKKLSFPFDLITDKHVWLEFPKIWPSEYMRWVEDRVKKNGMKISPQAAELLISKAGDSLRALFNELEKLKIYLEDKSEINLEDVVSVTGSSKETTVFDLQKAIGSKNLKQSVKVLIELLSSDRQEMLILAILQKYFLTLWKISEQDLSQNKYALAEKTGVNAYFLDEYLNSLKRYSPANIANAIGSLTEADELLKSSGNDNLFVMTNAIRKIIQG